MDSTAIKKVREALDAAGRQDIAIQITEGTIFTVEDAARTLSVPAPEILKSLVFLVDDAPTLVLMSGVNRVNSSAVARSLGARRAKMAKADYVLDRFGFQVGGVPPIGYPDLLPALLDEDLFQYDIVWSAAGTEHAFFPVSPQALLELTRGKRAAVKKEEKAIKLNLEALPE